MPNKGLGAVTSSKSATKVDRTAVLLRSALGGAAFAWAAAARAANVTSTWNATTGNWSDPTKWLNSPAAAAYPNNGNLGNTYDAVVNGGTVTLDVAATVRGLTLGG